METLFGIVTDTSVRDEVANLNQTTVKGFSDLATLLKQDRGR